MGIHPHLPPISLLLGSPVPLPWLSDDSRADRATNDDGVKKGAEGKTAGSEDGRLKRSIDRRAHEIQSGRVIRLLAPATRRAAPSGHMQQVSSLPVGDPAQDPAL